MSAPDRIACWEQPQIQGCVTERNRHCQYVGRKVLSLTDDIDLSADHRVLFGRLPQPLRSNLRTAYADADRFPIGQATLQELVDLAHCVVL